MTHFSHIQDIIRVYKITVLLFKSAWYQIKQVDYLNFNKLK